MSELLTVLAEMHAQPGKEEELRAHLLAMVAATHKEEGCVQYDLHVSTDAPGHFFFYEQWASRELLARHAASPHLTAFGQIAGDLLAEPVRVSTFTRIA
ncbi:MAG: antibiotic biosynthesis monooxygenase [Acidobacteria bacterium]|nr:antibiotic biosynthesis monooxygenase [Acidobacteriota bacterium]